MKHTNFIGLISLFVIVLIGCSKQDFKDSGEEVPAVKLDKKLQGCVSASLYGEGSGSTFNPFRKTFDDLGRVTMVVAPDFEQGLADSLFLMLHYGKNVIYFINQNNISDTVSTAIFDNQGRLQAMLGSQFSSFPTTEFFFSNKKLSSITTVGTNMSFVYDANGNVIRYEGEFVYEFTYDLNTWIDQQVYVDAAGGWILNNFFLAQIMGWTPDLDPVNRRTHTRISSIDGEFYNVDITDHVVDADGKLTNYTLGGYQMNLDWACRKGNMIY